MAKSNNAAAILDFQIIWVASLEPASVSCFSIAVLETPWTSYRTLTREGEHGRHQESLVPQEHTQLPAASRKF